MVTTHLLAAAAGIAAGIAVATCYWLRPPPPPPKTYEVHGLHVPETMTADELASAAAQILRDREGRATPTHRPRVLPN